MTILVIAQQALALLNSKAVALFDSSDIDRIKHLLRVPNECTPLRTIGISLATAICEGRMGELANAVHVEGDFYRCNEGFLYYRGICILHEDELRGTAGTLEGLGERCNELLSRGIPVNPTSVRRNCLLDAPERCPWLAGVYAAQSHWEDKKFSNAVVLHVHQVPAARYVVIVKERDLFPAQHDFPDVLCAIAYLQSRGFAQTDKLQGYTTAVQALNTLTLQPQLLKETAKLSKIF